MWLHNFELWQKINQAQNILDEEEKDAVPITRDDLAEIERYLKNLDKPRTIVNKQLDSSNWTDWQ